MNERRLIGNILAEDGEAEEQIRSTLTKRRVLLNMDELKKIHRRRRSDPELMSQSWPDEEHDLFSESPQIAPESPLDTKAAEFVPVKSHLCEYSGKILEMAKEQNGSRLLQQKLETFTQDEKLAVFEECIKNLKVLIVDVFGNFVIQKVLDVGNKEMRKSIALGVYGRVIELSLHMYACRVIQKLLECCEYEQKRTIVMEFKGNLEACLENECSNHVIQKSIEVLPYNCIEFIVNCIEARALYWIDNAYGCRVVQRIIENVPREPASRLINIVLINCVELSKKNYGNYVVQHILEKGLDSDKNELIKCFYGRINQLSKHKLAR